MSDTARIGRPRGQRPYEFNAQAAIRARVRKGLSRLQLSQRCEQVGTVPVDDSNITKYERGDVCPSPQTLVSLAAALDCTVDDLIVFPDAEGSAA